jgi:hypothetical protein
MRNPIRIARASLFAAAVCALASCGDSSLSQVSGKVTVDGQPMEKGAISFFPTDGKSPTTGGAIKAGQYQVQVPVGAMTVKISMPKVVGQKKLYNTPNSPAYPVTAEALPPRYNDQTTLKLEVKPGTTTKDWELQSK